MSSVHGANKPPLSDCTANTFGKDVGGGPLDGSVVCTHCGLQGHSISAKNNYAVSLQPTVGANHKAISATTCILTKSVRYDHQGVACLHHGLEICNSG